MTDWLRDPFVQAAVAPFLTGLFLVVVLRHFGGEKTGPQLSGGGVAAGLILITAWLAGVGPLPPDQTPDKLFYIVLVAALVPWVLALSDAGPRWRSAWAIVFPLLSVGWLGQTLFANAFDARLAFEAGGLVIGSWILFAALARADAPETALSDVGETVRAPIHLMVLGAAGGTIFFKGGGLTIAQLSGAAGALAGAYLLVTYVDQARERAVLLMDAHRTAAAGGWLALVHLGVLLSEEVPRGPLILLLAGPLLHPLARRLVFSSGIRQRLLSPVAYGVVVAIPAVAAVIWVMTGGGSGPYR